MSYFNAEMHQIRFRLGLGEIERGVGVCTIGNRHPPDEILATPLVLGSHSLTEDSA